jgi:hypothetical protein
MWLGPIKFRMHEAPSRTVHDVHRGIFDGHVRADVHAETAYRWPTSLMRFGEAKASRNEKKMLKRSGCAKP